MMPIYTLLTAFVALLQAAASRGQIPALASGFCLSLIASALVVTLVLPDYESYASLYASTPNIFELIERDVTLAGFRGLYGEPLYSLAASLAVTLGADFNTFRFIVIFFSLFLKLWVLRKLSPSFSISLVAYFALLFYVDSYLLRHAVAASLVAVGIVYLLSRNRLLFLLFTLLATGFHISAITAIPLIVISSARIGSKLALIIIFSAFMIGSLAPMGNVIASLSQASDHFITRALARYALSVHGEPVGLLRGSVVLYAVLLLFYIGLGPRIRRWYDWYYPVLSMSIYSLLFLLLLNDFYVLADRLFRTFALIFPLLIAAIVRTAPKNYLTVLYWGALTLIIAASTYMQAGERVKFMRLLF